MAFIVYKGTSEAASMIYPGLEQIMLTLTLARSCSDSLTPSSLGTPTHSRRPFTKHPPPRPPPFPCEYILPFFFSSCFFPAWNSHSFHFLLYTYLFYYYCYYFLLFPLLKNFAKCSNIHSSSFFPFPQHHQLSSVKEDWILLIGAWLCSPAAADLRIITLPLFFPWKEKMFLYIYIHMCVCVC